MAKHFPEHCAFAAADHQNAAGIPMIEQPWMHQRLVINMLVALSGLNDSVYKECATKSCRVDNRHILKLCLSSRQQTLDQIGVRLRSRRGVTKPGRRDRRGRAVLAHLL